MEKTTDFPVVFDCSGNKSPDPITPYKKNVSYVGTVLDKITKLRPVIYNLAYEKNNVNSGFITEEVYDVMPEIVTICVGVGKNSVSENRSVSIPRLVPYLVRAIQEQQEKIDKLEKMIYSQFSQHNDSDNE